MPNRLTRRSLAVGTITATAALGLLGLQLFGSSSPSGANEPEPLTEEVLDCPAVTDPDGNAVEAYVDWIGEPDERLVTPSLLAEQTTPERALSAYLDAASGAAIPGDADDFTTLDSGPTWHDFALTDEGQRTAVVRVVKLPTTGIWEMTKAVACQG